MPYLSYSEAKTTKIHASLRYISWKYQLVNPLILNFDRIQGLAYLE